MTDWYIPPLRLLYPTAFWTGPRPYVYLTFDDGPHSEATPAVLDLLDQNNVRSTFFLTGSCAAAEPDLVRRIAGAGHSIGIHGYEHRSYLLRTWSDISTDIESSRDVIRGITGALPVLFRPPYGRLRPTLLGRVRSLGLRTVLWSVNSWDYDPSVTGEKIVSMVVRRTSPGDILLFHDNDKSVGRGPQYLEGIIDGLRSRGHSFSTL